MKRFISLTAMLLCLCFIFSACTVSTTEGGAASTEGTVSDTSGGETGETGQDPVDPDDYFANTKIEIVTPDTSLYPDMAVTDKGYDIYSLTKGKEYGYRYGCTYLYNDDGSVDAYFACVGANTGEWDWIAYRHSPDNGETWEDEKIVLTPTQGSMDRFSNCDPAVVYFNGYYYLAYTSTLNNVGTCNNIFVCRSKNPDGPFEKWNGSGWGGYDPQPLFYFEEAYGSWGMGEPAFVELNGTLYIYYTNIAVSGDYMMVATADATDENWPLTIKQHGVACKKNTDSLDVKYVEEWGKFIGIATGDRMGSSSWIAVYQSNDGMKFELADVVREGTYTHLHNAGISSRPNGHIKVNEDGDRLRVIYAYGEGWGTWNTRVHPVTLTLSEGNDMAAEKAKKNLEDEKIRLDMLNGSDRFITMVRPEKDVYTVNSSKKSFNIRLYRYDTYFNKTELRDTDNVSFVVYDESVVTIKGQKATVVAPGTTAVEVRYEDHVFLFHITVTEGSSSVSASKATALVPQKAEHVIYTGEKPIFRPQIRVNVIWGDGSFDQYTCNDSDPELSYTGYDESIISVSEKGIITALKAGKTQITVAYKELTCTVDITVTDDEAYSFFKMGDFKSVDYSDIDFSDKDNLTIATRPYSADLSFDADIGALKATSTGIDAQFYLTYGQSDISLNAEDYRAIEITYMVPEDTSSQATNMQLFICAGETENPAADKQAMIRLVRDGQFHTATVSLSKLSFWKGQVHLIRVDFFDQSTPGDTIYIKNVKLIEQ